MNCQHEGCKAKSDRRVREPFKKGRFTVPRWYYLCRKHADAYIKLSTLKSEGGITKRKDT